MSLLQTPEELKLYPNWIVWKYATRDGKETKLPYDPKQNGNALLAETNNPDTWASFAVASEVADVLNGSDYDGIGLVLPPGLGGLDFDVVIDDGVPEPYVLAIIKLAGEPYTEISPSGNGLRAFINVPTPPINKGCNFRGKKNGVDKYGAEFYIGGQTNKYLTVTGDHFSGKGIPTPKDINLVHFLMFRIGDWKFKQLWVGNWRNAKNAKNEPFTSQSEADLALCSLLVRGGFTSAETLDAAFRQSGLMRDEWEHKSKYTIAKALSGKESTASTGVQPTAAIEFHTLAQPDPDGEYVVAPLPNRDDGWFPLGDISLIGGSSGTGKTTWIFEMLHKQKQGWPVHEHRTYSRLFHVLAYDRRKNAFTRTMRRMHLLPSDIPTTALPQAYGREAVQTIINEIEKLSPLPSIILLEGLDMLIDDANKKSVVSPFMRQLQEVAAHFHIALIGSVGAPKTKRGEGYAAKRDKLSGSEAWGRNCETVVVIEYSEDDDGTGDRRELTVLPRNAKTETFSLEFQNGLLAVVQPETRPDVIFKPKRAREITWFRQQAELAKTDATKEWFTVTDFVEGLEIPQSTAAKHIADALTKGFIKIKTGPKVTKWAAEQYQWNNSDSNSLLAAQQDEYEETTLLTFKK